MLNHGSGSSADWDAYFQMLLDNRHMLGGSALAAGISLQGSQFSAPLSSTITGYLLIQAESLEQAKQIMFQSPVHKSGGTVEMFALVKS